MAACMVDPAAPAALAFDVFGTVVDWRSGIARQSAEFLLAIGRSDLDCQTFADRWRARYLPAMAAVRNGRRAFVLLDTLHREMLVDLLKSEGVDASALDPALLDDWAHAWHRLDPWPDAVQGLLRLKTRFPIVTLSNGNVALILDMARRAGLPWDAILGAEFTRAYKPDPQAYLGTAAGLGTSADRLCLVAAHHSDLAAARSCGLRTAFVARPMEYGGRPAPDAGAAQVWDWSVDGLDALADRLGC